MRSRPNIDVTPIGESVITQSESPSLLVEKGANVEISPWALFSRLSYTHAKDEYLSRYESRISERAQKVIVRMFRDGPAGVAAGLSAAKWMRMTKVSKPTATRDLEALAQIGAIVPVGAGPSPVMRLTVHPRMSRLRD